ncbi:MAG: hypothetical protein AAGF12_16420 [Myxococcota bacterium]
MGRTARLFLAGVLLVGCGKAPPPELELAPGKADISDSVQLLGPLELGGEVRGEFTEELQTFAYTFTVRPGAVVTLDNSNLGTSRNLDSLLYVFGPRTEAGFGTRSLSRDDDSGWGAHARIRDLELTEGGEYLVAITTYLGSGFGRYRLALKCENGECAPEGPCTFGDAFWQLEQSEHVFVVRRREIRSTDGLTAVEREQLVAAVSFHANPVRSAEEALENVDAGAVNALELWDTSNARAFEVYEFGLGDNSFGSFFDIGQATIAANIVDGDIYDCAVPRGPQGADCRSNADCENGLSCEGTVDGLGRCFDTSFSHPAETADCARFESADRRDITDSCPSGSGLICSGVFDGGDGLCFPVWQRSREAYLESFDQSVEVAGGETLEVPFTFYGMTTVSMDSRVSGFISGGSEVSIRLTNDLGTAGTVLDGSVSGFTHFNQPAVGIPGDEDANGQWFLAVENRGSSSVFLGEVAVEIQSRYD